MAKVLLLTFDVDSGESRRKDFEEAGFSVSLAEPGWPAAQETARAFGPAVIAVDCGHLPSRCRETARNLRTSASTGSIPLVLFRVADHDLERTRLEVPGGVVAFDYELLDRLRSAALTRLAQLAAQEEAEPASEQQASPDPGSPGTDQQQAGLSRGTTTGDRGGRARTPRSGAGTAARSSRGPRSGTGTKPAPRRRKH